MAQIEGMQAVSILGRVNGCQQRPLVQARRQGQLQQNSIHLGVGIEPLDGAQNLGCGCPGRQMGPQVGDANTGARLFLIGHIHTASGVISHPQHRQTRGAASQGQAFSHRAVQSLFDLARQLTAVQAHRHGKPHTQKGILHPS